MHYLLAQAYGQGAYSQATYSQGTIQCTLPSCIQVGPVGPLPVTGALGTIASAALIAAAVTIVFYMRTRRRRASASSLG